MLVWSWQGTVKNGRAGGWMDCWMLSEGCWQRLYCTSSPLKGGGCGWNEREVQTAGDALDVLADRMCFNSWARA